MNGLAKAAGHADRYAPLQNYCKGWLLPGDRKSVEPIAARLAPDNVRRMHQSLHHLVADAPWNDEEMLAEVRRQVLPSMQKHSPVVAWIVDDTGFPKQGKHSVGVARQYCGQMGKHDNCQAAVSLSVSTWNSSLPMAWRLYLPEVWCEDAERCRQAGVPEGLGFKRNRRSPWSRFGKRWRNRFPWEWFWQMRGTGKALSFARSLPNSVCNMQ